MTPRPQQTMKAAEFRKLKPKPKGRGTGRGKGGPNDNESKYRDMHLDPCSSIVDFEAKTFVLAERCTYTPDWQVTITDGLGRIIGYEFHEVKHDKAMLSGKQEDSRVKFKCASTIYPEFVFVWAKWSTKKKCYKREFWKGGRKIE